MQINGASSAAVTAASTQSAASVLVASKALDAQKIQGAEVAELIGGAAAPTGDHRGSRVNVMA